jgi:hypothetical protein
MGFLRDILGRKPPPGPQLDQLFAIPDAAVTLQVSAGFLPTGVGAVCYRAAEGGAFTAAETDITELLDADGGPKVEKETDSFGFTWLVCRQDPSAISDLVTELHAVNRGLEDNGFGPALLCSVVAFAGPDGRKVGIVYLYKQGTFYPFAPTGPQRRDNALELQIRGIVSADLPIEKQLQRWLAVWGAPGLDS